MQALIRTALQQNYDVRIAVARILEAQAQLGITRSFLFPTVDGTALRRDRISEERFLTPPSGQNEGNTFFLGLASSMRSISGAGYGARPRPPVLSCSPPSGPSGPSW